MKYELLKRLRDAGFPHYWGTAWLPETPIEIAERWYPTLSELINACTESGAKFQVGQTYTEPWNARIQKILNGVYYERNGDTPEEAVAELWLALNEKK